MLTRRQLLAGSGASFSLRAASAPPNIILIVADDLGWGELGCQGNPEIPTPNIDSIARNGIRFTQAYSSAPFCSPSRAGLITGRYQTRFGHELNAIGKQNNLPNVGLPFSEITLADRLRAAGYRTACIGKWHLGGSEPYHPLRRGFDEFYGFLHEGHFYVPPPYKEVVSRLRAKEPPYDEENPLRRNGGTLTESAYLTEALTREACAFIDRSIDQKREKPFFLYLPYNAVHSPMQATPKDLGRFSRIADAHRRIFAAMLASMDDGVGQVLSTLRKHRIENNTLVMFVSDNGGPTEELTSSNGPLRGRKGLLWEGGIRVPMMMQWKGRIPSGRLYQHPVIHLDLFATALAAAQAKPPTHRVIDGVDLLNKGKSRPHETLFWRHGRWYALRKGDHKLVYQAARGSQQATLELFDLGKDPTESNDIASTKPQLLSELKSEWDRLNAQMVAPLWGRG